MTASLIAATGQEFWNTSAGGILQVLLGAVGVILALVTALKAFGKFSGGKPAEGAKIIVGGLLVCAFLFRPQLLNEVIGFIGDLFETILGGGQELIDQQPTGTTPPAEG
jgi:hypothetical protein